jgi:hypothetical protein
MAFSTQPTGSGTGVLSGQPVVTLKDAGGNTVTTDATVPTLSLSSGTGALTGCSGVNTTGVVAYSGCSISTTGAKALTATMAGPITVISAAFTL